VVTTTWAVLILPELERKDVFEAYQTGQLPNTYVDLYVCPSDAKTHTGAETSYVANGGMLGPAMHQSIANGVFVNRVWDGGMAMTDGAWVDGRDYTLAYSENTSATFYDEEGWNIWYIPDTMYDSDEQGVPCIGTDRTWNPVFLWAREEKDRVPINSDGAPKEEVERCKIAFERRFKCETCNESAGRAAASWARPASYHGAGVNVAFGSGRVLFLRENIDYKVYIALMTPNEELSASPNREFMLEDKHLR
jgi:hypothetical protein